MTIHLRTTGHGRDRRYRLDNLAARENRQTPTLCGARPTEHDQDASKMRSWNTASGRAYLAGRGACLDCLRAWAGAAD